MREYEMICVLKPDSTDEAVDRVFGRVQRVLDETGGLLLSRDSWGKKKLAYEIDRNAKGLFFEVKYLGGGALNNEMTRVLRIDDAVLRFMPVLVAVDVDVEARVAAAQERREQVSKPSDDEEPEDD